MNNDITKAIPHSIEAEQAVVGGLMLSRNSGIAFDSIADMIKKEDFYRYDHAMIFDAVSELQGNRQADFVTISEYLERNDKLYEAGGAQYLRDLTRSVPSSANIKHYAKIVKDRSIERQLQNIGGDIQDIAVGNGKTDEKLNSAQELIMSISESAIEAGAVSAKEALTGVIEQLEIRSEIGDGIVGMRTGFSEYDNLTSGLEPGALVIVAGRPAMGKTTFALNIAEHAAIDNNKSILVFSMEMPKEQLIMRSIASRGQVDFGKLRKAQMEEHEWAAMSRASAEISKTKLFIDDRSGMSPQQIRTTARKIKREHGLDMIVIDYLQLMRVPGISSNNRTLEIGEISRSLKEIAKELQVPVIALSKLNRALEQRPNKRPLMSDLRESGSIEQDADIITFLYRDEVYNEESAHRGIGEVITVKQRNGEIGTIMTRFEGKYCRFRDLQEGEIGEIKSENASYYTPSEDEGKRSTGGFNYKQK